MSEYYNLNRILPQKAIFNILLGQRSNGKSYSVKTECVKEAFLGMGNLIYLRRWDLELKQDDIQDYFRDCPVEEITGGQYNFIEVYRKRIYLALVNEDGDTNRGPCIGRAASLSSSEHLKSVIQRGEYKNIIYEEFCTNSGYLRNEPGMLMQFVATCFGNQNVGRVWLIGNTVSRYNPYFYTWQLRNIQKMQPGDLDLYEFTTEEGNKIKLAVEFCSTMKVSNKMYFGDTAAQITTGVWETESQQGIPEDFGNFKVAYQVFLQQEQFSFLLKVIENKQKERLLLVAPAEEEDKEKTRRKILDHVTGDPFSTDRLVPLTAGDNVILMLFKLGKIVYANNLTGSDFKSILKTKSRLMPVLS